MTKIQFTAQLFVTEHYQGWKVKRDKDATITGDLSDYRKFGINITDIQFIKHGKSGRHDGYAKGWYYRVIGETE